MVQQIFYCLTATPEQVSQCTMPHTLQAIALIWTACLAQAILDDPLPCPAQSDCIPLSDSWMCNAGYELTSCDSCMRSEEYDGIDCTASCYASITPTTAPVLVAARAAALLKDRLDRLSDWNLFPLSASIPPLSALDEEFRNPVPRLFSSPDGGSPPPRLLANGRVRYRTRFDPWGCGEDVFMAPRPDRNKSEERSNTFLLINPLWCSLSLTGRKRVPVKTDLHVQGSSSLWKEAVRAAMDHIVSEHSGSWSNIFKRGLNGRPRFKLKRKRGKRYVVVLFFRRTYLRQVRTLCA